MFSIRLNNRWSRTTSLSYCLIGLKWFLSRKLKHRKSILFSGSPHKLYSRTTSPARVLVLQARLASHAGEWQDLLAGFCLNPKQNAEVYWPEELPTMEQVVRPSNHATIASLITVPNKPSAWTYYHAMRVYDCRAMQDDDWSYNQPVDEMRKSPCALWIKTFWNRMANSPMRLDPQVSHMNGC
jgi:hypothetical protein